MGSVKDLELVSPAYENRPGEGYFLFSDRYSVFDWGEMPDHIAGKGAALAVMSAFNFEQLERRGIRTHYRGLKTAAGALVRFDDLPEESGGCALMRVALARVYEPTARLFLAARGTPEVRYDYSFFTANRGKLNNFLVPLEVIFRNGLPLGSSVFAKIEKIKAGTPGPEGTAGKAALTELLSALGLKREPEPGQMLPRPIMSFSTKLESGDRGLEEREAFEISGLTEDDFRELTKIGLGVNDFISEQAEKTGLAHYDGKIELIYDGGLVLADVVGTFDENRFAFRKLENRQISKEMVRQWYKRNQSDFPAACEAAKSSGAGWQARCAVKPLRLPPELVSLTAAMYQAGCNRYTGRRVFDVPELEDVLEALEPYRR
jgi:phosphoribosylaminoimidazole-succinocarboxamide synthase